MDEETGSIVCGLIAGVIASDDEMHVNEASFLRRMRDRFGVKPGTQVQPVTDHGEAVAKLGALPDGVRQETLGLLIQAATADGKVAAPERALLGAVAAALQVGEAELDERLQQEIVGSKPQPFGLAESTDDSD
jgi:uncharacterized tellurite resistance protein B-like protein